jgi:nucleotide-binding universal stress UspA family protein
MRHGEPPRSILVPLDGSWRSESALVPAVPLARRIGARIVLLTTQWSASETATSRRYLETRRAELRNGIVGGTAFTNCDLDLAVDRDARHAIIAAAADAGTLVCMATHGHGGVVRGVLGSVSEQVVRAGVAPVLLTGPDLDSHWVLPDVPEVVVALDGSHTAREALPAALSLTHAIGGTLRLVHVPVAVVPDEDTCSENGVAMLQQVREWCDAQGVSTIAEVLDGFDPAAVLVDDAERRCPAFLVAATHGRSGLARITMGSVVQRIVRRARCPVLVVRPTILAAGDVGRDGAREREEVHDARRSWRRDRGRSQSRRSAAAQG